MVIDVTDKARAEDPVARSTGRRSTRSAASWTAPGPTARRARSSTCATPPSPRLSGRLARAGDTTPPRRHRGLARHRADLHASRCMLLDARDRPGEPDRARRDGKMTRLHPRQPVAAPAAPTTSLLVGGEATGPDCAEDASATFQTWDARIWRADRHVLAARRVPPAHRPARSTAATPETTLLRPLVRPAPDLPQRRPGRDRLVRARHALPAGRQGRQDHRGRLVRPARRPVLGRLLDRRARRLRRRLPAWPRRREVHGRDPPCRLIRGPAAAACRRCARR